MTGEQDKQRFCALPLERRVVQQWWSAHPLDKWGQMFLLDIAHSAAPPKTQPCDSPDWCGDVTLPALDGWKVCFFYDCGELDYIDHFVTPEGEKLEVWPNDYQSEQSPPVMNWRDTSDTERFRGLLHNALGNRRAAFGASELTDGLEG
jgi:hypothetical protein